MGLWESILGFGNEFGPQDVDVGPMVMRACMSGEGWCCERLCDLFSPQRYGFYASYDESRSCCEVAAAFGAPATQTM